MTTGRRPEPEYRCTLYLGENLCQCAAILSVLEQAQFPFRRHLEFFEYGIEDHVWMQLPGLMGWPILTKDARHRYEPLEKARIVEYCLREFTFSSGNLSGEQMAELLRLNLPKIERLSRKHPPPFLASITRGGVHPRKIV